MLNHSLFICGSLCADMVHNKLLQDAILNVQSAEVLGSVYRLEVGFPVFSAVGDSRISGEWIELKHSDLIWQILDQYHSYSETKVEKSAYYKTRITVNVNGELKEALTYSVNMAKLPKAAKMIAGGDWRADFQNNLPLTKELSEEEAQYIQRLGKCTGREIVPYTPLTRELEKRGIVIDKGRRPALTKLGKELFQYLD